MRRILACSLCLIVSICVLLPFQASAQSTGWRQPIAVDNGRFDASLPSVAMNGQDDALVAWVQWDGVRADVCTRQFSDGVWGPVNLLSELDGEASLIQVALNNNGIGVAVWRQSLGGNASIFASFLIDGGWGFPNALDNGLGYATNPQIALDDEGRAFAAWTQIDASPETNVYANGYVSGSWGSPVPLDNLSGLSGDVRVAMSNGDAVVTWKQYDGAHYSAYASHFSGSWTLPFPLEVNDGDVYFPRVAMGNGSAIVVWDQAYGVGYHLFANRYSSGEWGTAVLIEDIQFDSVLPQIVMSGDDAIVVWSQNDDSSFIASIYANRFISGQWGNATLLEDMSDVASNPQVAMLSENEAMAIWTQANNIYGSLLSNGVWGTPAIVQHIEASIDSHDVSLVSGDGHGNGIAVWQQKNPPQTVDSVFASFYVSGLSLTVSDPVSGSSVDSSSVLVAGITSPRANLVVNGYEVLVSENGSFSALIPLAKGENVITATATDRVWGSVSSTSLTVTYDVSDPGPDYGPIGLALSVIALVVALVAIVLAVIRRRN